jgi:hypothetical protein
MTITELAGASAQAAGPIITEPGIYEMTNEQYHADPVPGGSLSSSGARRLLAPGCPALFDYERRHRRAPRPQFDIGHAAHLLVLGEGPELVVIDAADWRTKAAQTERAVARESGAVPVLRHEFEQVQAMAEAIRRHPVAGALFNPAFGRPEQSLFWQDAMARVWRRARLDWLPHPGAGRLIVPDYKTTVSAASDAIERSVHSYGYHQQAAWYLDAVRALGLADDSAQFVFVFQEKTAPYLVRVVQLSASAMRIGRHLNRKAIATYAECTAADRWPGYSDDIDVISLPAWAETKHLQEMQ